MSFKPGDHVRFGHIPGPVMVVTGVYVQDVANKMQLTAAAQEVWDLDTSQVVCGWFDAENTYQTAKLPTIALERVFK